MLIYKGTLMGRGWDVGTGFLLQRVVSRDVCWCLALRIVKSELGVVLNCEVLLGFGP